MADTRVFGRPPVFRFVFPPRFPVSLSLAPSVSSTSELTVLLPGVFPVLRADLREAGVFTGTDEERAEPPLLARVLDVFGGGDNSEEMASSSSESSGMPDFSALDALDEDLEVEGIEVDGARRESSV